MTGVGTPHLPPDLPAARWAFGPRPRQARFVIIDKLWHNWVQQNVPGVSEMMQTAAGWPLVFAAGDIQVYENPYAIKPPPFRAP